MLRCRDRRAPFVAPTTSVRVKAGARGLRDRGRARVHGSWGRRSRSRSCVLGRSSSGWGSAFLCHVLLPTLIPSSSSPPVILQGALRARTRGATRRSSCTSVRPCCAYRGRRTIKFDTRTPSVDEFRVGRYRADDGTRQPHVLRTSSSHGRFSPRLHYHLSQLVLEGGIIGGCRERSRMAAIAVTSRRGELRLRLRTGLSRCSA